MTFIHPCIPGCKLVQSSFKLAGPIFYCTQWVEPMPSYKLLSMEHRLDFSILFLTVDNQKIWWMTLHPLDNHAFNPSNAASFPPTGRGRR